MKRKTLKLILLISIVPIGMTACNSGKNNDGLMLAGLLSVSGGQTGTVDGSHDGTTGETVDPTSASGTLIPAASREKRYQTFVANCHTTITGVQIKIRKKSATQTYGDLTVELYDTDESSKPLKRLAGTTVNEADIGTNFAVVKAKLRYRGLEPGAKYAIVLGQDLSLAVLNDGYEWCVKEIGTRLNFGRYNESTTIVEDWLGDGWLIVNVSGGDCPVNTSTCNAKDTSGSSYINGTQYSAVANEVDGGATAISVVTEDNFTEVILCFDSSCATGIIVRFPGQSTGTFTNHTEATAHIIYNDDYNYYYVGKSTQEMGITDGSIVITHYDSCYVSGTFSGHVANYASGNPSRVEVPLTNGSFKAYRVTPPSQTYAIGATGPAGGLVFYDKGRYTNGWRYLESAPAATEWEDTVWQDPFTSFPDLYATIGTGKANTAAIVEVLNAYTPPQTGRAAQLCNNLNYGGHCDWFLPSYDEMALMYDNLQASGLGGFSLAHYWTSTNNGSGNVWDKGFPDGSNDDPQPQESRYVRAIRAF